MKRHSTHIIDNQQEGIDLFKSKMQPQYLDVGRTIGQLHKQEHQYLRCSLSNVMATKLSTFR
jgi:hypothetical protein